MESMVLFLIFVLFVVPSVFGRSSHDHDHTGSKKELIVKDHNEIHSDHKSPQSVGHEHDDDHNDSHSDQGGSGEDNHEHDEGHNHSHESHSEQGEKFGEGKAIVEIKREGDQFRLSKEAISLIGIQSKDLVSIDNDVYRVDRSALVFYRNNVAIYSSQGDWFEIIDVSELTIKGEHAEIRLKAKPKGKIVTKGVALLRVAHLEATGQGGQGHVH